MDVMNDALKYVVQSKKIVGELFLCFECAKGTEPPQIEMIHNLTQLLERAEEALVKTK